MGARLACLFLLVGCAETHTVVSVSDPRRVHTANVRGEDGPSRLDSRWADDHVVRRVDGSIVQEPNARGFFDDPDVLVDGRGLLVYRGEVRLSPPDDLSLAYEGCRERRSGKGCKATTRFEVVVPWGEVRKVEARTRVEPVVATWLTAAGLGLGVGSAASFVASREHGAGELVAGSALAAASVTGLIAGLYLLLHSDDRVVFKAP